MSADGQRRVRVPEHPELAALLADFDAALTQVSLALVQRPAERLTMVKFLRDLEHRGVLDASVLPDRPRAVCERVVTAIYTKTSRNSQVFAQMAMGAWLAAYALAQEYEACQTCGEFAPDPHAAWCTAREPEASA